MKLGLTHCLLTLALSTNFIGVEAFAHEVQQKTVERREVQITIDDFTLIDQNSRQLKFRQLAGRVVVVAFAYTTCPDVCPFPLGRLCNALTRGLSHRRDDYRRRRSRLRLKVSASGGKADRTADPAGRPPRSFPDPHR